MQKPEVIIIGAGAAGLMCAIEAARRKRKVIIFDHANKPGKKILMSGGGRCNFTNLHIDPDQHYFCHHKNFYKSALSRYTPDHFIELVKAYHIPYHEKTQGQLFCDHKSKDIVDMLLSECQKFSVRLQLNTDILAIKNLDINHFEIQTSIGRYECESLVIASGGLSIPTMGASPLGYKIAEQFGLSLYPARAGLVPLTLHPEDKEKLSVLSGISTFCSVTNQSGKNFSDNILFTHRGLSGPAILQISSYWQGGEILELDLLPQINLTEHLKIVQKNQPQKKLLSVLSEYLPKRMAEVFINFMGSDIGENKLQALSYKNFDLIGKHFNAYSIKPNGTEGYRTAEVTLGGVDCSGISSKTMQALRVPGLYFIGEVLDVQGWLGGYNFQWAWASGYVCGQAV